MGILWTILKIIGILLAVILGLLLLVLLIILFVPLRYRLKGAKEPETGRIWIKGRISWLLSIAAITFGYDESFAFQIRLFGVPLNLSKENEEEEESDKEFVKEYEKLREKPEDKGPVLQAASLPDVSKTETLTPETPKADVSKTEAFKTEIPKSKDFKTEAVKTETQQAEVPKVSVIEKIRTIFAKITNFLRTIPQKIDSVKEKIRSLKEEADYWIAFIQLEEVKQLWRLAWRQIKKMFRHFLPTKIRIKGRFGMEDPSLTGQIYGVMNMLPVRYQKRIAVTPDFNEACLEGEFFLKGRIRVWSLLVLGLRLLLDSNLRKVYKKLKTEKINGKSKTKGGH